jgi:hypothetical protein
MHAFEYAVGVLVRMAAYALVALAMGAAIVGAALLLVVMIGALR